MNRIFEVNIAASAAKTIYISAQTAEEAAHMAEVLYNEGIVRPEDDVRIGVAAVSTDNEQCTDYYEGLIKEAESEEKVCGTLEECKNCKMYEILRSIYPQE